MIALRVAQRWWVAYLRCNEELEVIGYDNKSDKCCNIIL